MPAGGMPASSQPLRWPLRPRTTAALAASGLLLLLFSVSRRIWRGGGRKTRDPGGTESSNKVKEKKCKEQECLADLENFLVTSIDEEVLVDQPNILKAKEPQATLLVQPVELPLVKEAGIIEEESISIKQGEEGPEGKIETENLVSFLKESLSATIKDSKQEECQISKSVYVEQEKSSSLDTDLSTVKEVVIIKGELLDCHTDSKAEEIDEKQKNLVSEEEVAIGIIPEVCGSVSRQEAVSSKVVEVSKEEDKEVVSKSEFLVCHKDVKAKGEAIGEQNSLAEEKFESTSIIPLTCRLVRRKEEKENLQGTADSVAPQVTRKKKSFSVSGEGEGFSQEVVLDQPVEEVMLMKQVKSDLEVKSESSVTTAGEDKGGRGGQEVVKVENQSAKNMEEVKGEMEVKDMVRDNVESVLQNDGVGEVEEHPNKCGVSAGQVPMDATGIGSPSMSNFPDNRSEGSSCGDSGKGRSDVTTPGGLEEEEREVSFPRHFSPPCSTSGPEEEEEENRNVAVEDGNMESNSGGAVVLGEAAGMLVDGSMVPVGVPLPIYHGIVPIAPPPSVYEFVIPQGLVGRLIGKHGSFVNLIKARTSANIFIKTHPETTKLKVCAIEGTESEIQAALEMIREKFPQRRYSSMTLEQVFFLPLPPPPFTLIPDSLHLHLVEGVSNDVILSAMVSPSHYFLQQPTHPTYPTLAKLDMWMSVSYQDANVPMLPESVEPGIICAAPTMGGWYRAQIVAVEEQPSISEDGSTEEGELVKWCDIRFVDYGGYERLPSHSLRQIRSDFMTLPFQASECYLASVVPASTSDDNKTTGGWSMEAYSLVEELTQAQVLQAQVVGHAHDGLPLVLLYAYSHSFGQVVQVNDELVRRGLAIWAVPVVEVDQIIGESASEEDQQAQEEESEAKDA